MLRIKREVEIHVGWSSHSWLRDNRLEVKTQVISLVRMAPFGNSPCSLTRKCYEAANDSFRNDTNHAGIRSWSLGPVLLWNPDWIGRDQNLLPLLKVKHEPKRSEMLLNFYSTGRCKDKITFYGDIWCDIHCDLTELPLASIITYILSTAFFIALFPVLLPFFIFLFQLFGKIRRLVDTFRFQPVIADVLSTFLSILLTPLTSRLTLSFFLFFTNFFLCFLHRQGQFFPLLAIVSEIFATALLIFFPPLTAASPHSFTKTTTNDSRIQRLWSVGSIFFDIHYEHIWKSISKNLMISFLMILTSNYHRWKFRYWYDLMYWLIG